MGQLKLCAPTTKAWALYSPFSATRGATPMRSLCTTAREPPPLAATRESPCTAKKSLCAAVKTQHSQKQINKQINNNEAKDTQHMQTHRGRKASDALSNGENFRVTGHRTHGGWRHPPPRGNDVCNELYTCFLETRCMWWIGPPSSRSHPW